MIVFKNANEFQLDEIEDSNHTVSTLLIPENLMGDFLFLLKDHKVSNVAAYLQSLLTKYKTLTHSGMFPIPIKLKTEYQEEGLNLKRIGFRPFNADWVELGELALAFGKSRCWIFVYLLKLDIMGLWNLLVRSRLDFAVPTSANVELQSFWTFRRFQHNFARSYHVKV